MYKIEHLETMIKFIFSYLYLYFKYKSFQQLLYAFIRVVDFDTYFKALISFHKLHLGKVLFSQQLVNCFNVFFSAFLGFVSFFSLFYWLMLISIFKML